MQLVPTYPQHREKESKHQGHKSHTAWLPSHRARILVCHFAHYSCNFTSSTLVGFFTFYSDTYVQVICITKEKHQFNPIQHHKLKSIRICEILCFRTLHYKMETANQDNTHSSKCNSTSISCPCNFFGCQNYPLVR